MKKYYAITILIVLAALFAYHFYAADKAEQNIDTSIQEITSELNPPLSVSYSSVEVGPFSGDVHFTDLNIIRNQDIRRAQSVLFDFSYFDFLKISLFGAEYGLKRIESANINFNRLSITNRANLTEFKLNSLNAGYQGELWKLLRIGFHDSTASSEHTLIAEGSNFTISLPGFIGIINTDTLNISSVLKNKSGNESFSATASLKKLSWNPTDSFKNQYRFFIQGFGYEPDSIPFQKAKLDFDYKSKTPILSINEMSLQSELFTGILTGKLNINSDTLSATSFDSASLRFSDLAPPLQNVLSNAEKLFGIKIPMADSTISMGISGTFLKPTIRMDNQ
ncbi:hypothetical protein G3570_15395 [Balneolaceae bacterium YR4-1]|uniref:AsmA domain-containing protein n=1 Tax=Halalkalibaculum roseum TaxID=2709311 RepID=A0A6M1TCY9_9BACT|nr:hypothetical protein [Halalkalibaculum roseum]NGP78033.1 hypothetical protein [Halalkalibaculum roseum]